MLSKYISDSFLRLDQYIHGITANTITCGRLEKLSVDRFILLRQKYLYNKAAVKRVVKFFYLLNIPQANQIRRYELQDYELFWIANLFGIYKDTTTRLFNEAYISIAKKNNKSTFAAALALYSCIADNILNSHVLMVASSREQSSTLIKYLDTIVKNSPALTPLFKVNKNLIYNKSDKKYNRIEIRASDAKRIHSVGAGMGLSVIDEYAVHKDSSLKEVIKKSQAVVQKNHLQLIITHATTDKTKSPAFSLQEFCKNILEGKAENDEYFTAIYTLDDKEEIHKPDAWRKSNPSINRIVSFEALVSEYKSALVFPEKMVEFQVFNLNLWADNLIETWISDDIIKEVSTREEIPEGSKIYLGVDLSQQLDLTAIALLWHDKPNDRFVTKVINILPNNNRSKIRDHGSIDLQRWIISDDNPNGYIIKGKLEVLDWEQVFGIVRDIKERYKIQTLGIDPNLAVQLAYRFESQLGIFVTKISQDWTMSEPLRIMERLIHLRKLNLTINPVVRWNFENVLMKISDKGNYYLKKKNGEAIDSVVSIAIAFAAWLADNKHDFEAMAERYKLRAYKKQTE